MDNWAGMAGVTGAALVIIGLASWGEEAIQGPFSEALVAPPVLVSD